MVQENNKQDIAYRQTKRLLTRVCERLDVQEGSPTAIFLAESLKEAWENGHAQGVADMFWDSHSDMVTAQAKKD